MRWIYEYLFLVMWVGFFVYWQIAAAGAKTTQRIESVPSRVFRTAIFLAGVVLLSFNDLPIPWVYRQYLRQGAWSFWTGAGITAAGILFAVWARRHIGRNWSRSVTIKEDHQLITSGPYAHVRHPIYTGLLVAFLGTGLAVGEYRGILAFLLVFISLWYKLRLEEKWMRAQFGEAYTDYSRRTAALVPGIL